jgi:hypothetical protein
MSVCVCAGTKKLAGSLIVMQGTSPTFARRLPTSHRTRKTPAHVTFAFGAEALSGARPRPASVTSRLHSASVLLSFDAEEAVHRALRFRHGDAGHLLAGIGLIQAGYSALAHHIERDALVEQENCTPTVPIHHERAAPGCAGEVSPHGSHVMASSRARGLVALPVHSSVGGMWRGFVRRRSK